MKILVSATLLVTFALSNCMLGCASQPDKLQSQYVSPLQYQDYDCEQIEQELETVSNRVATLYTDLKKLADGDSAQAAIGAVIFWPALFFLEGGDGPEANEYSRLLGEKAALDEIAIHKKCPIDLNQYELITEKLKREQRERQARQNTTIKKKMITGSYDIAIFPLNIHAATWGSQYIGDLKRKGVEGIANVASNDDSLVLKYCYKECGNITQGVRLIEDVSKKPPSDVWKKESFFSAKEPDWEEIRKIGLEIDTDLIVTIRCDIGTQHADFYLYHPKSNKLYSVNTYAHYSHFGLVAEKTVRTLVDDFYIDQPALAKEQPLLNQQDVKRPKNNNGKILEQKLITVDSNFKNEIDCYRIKYLSDGLKVVGFIVKPKKINNKLPVIIFNRGGNREYYKISEETLRVLSYYASQNYVILASQYRGNDGGQGHEAFGGKDVNDVLSLIPLAQSLSYTDSTKIVMLGASRGGMMTYLAIKEGADIRAAAVISGFTDLFQTYQERDDKMKKVLRELVGDDDNEYKIRSACYWPERIDVPVLILHGEDDYRIKVTQAQKLSKKLAAAGKVHKLVVYPKGDHGLKTHHHERDRRILEWFETYLKQ